MSITSITKDGGYLVIVEDGVTTRRSIVYEDTVVSEPPTDYEEVGNIYINSSGNLVVNYNGSSIEIQTDDLTGAEIVTLLEALGIGSRLSHTKLDDVGASDHHAKYTDRDAEAAIRAIVTEFGDILLPALGTYLTRLPIGTDGQVLTVDTSIQTAQMKWAIPDHGVLGGLLDDDHTQYQKETEKDAASGYAGLDASSDIAVAAVPDGIKTATITFIIDGGGVAITTGQKGHLEIPFACTIQQVTMLADVAGAIVVDIWKQAYADFPPENANSITSSAPPTIAATNQQSQDSTLTDWTTTITAGDCLAFNVDSCTTITRVTISLKVIKT